MQQVSYYSSTCLTVEVGTRGYLSQQTAIALRRLGVWSQKLHRDLSSTALRGSYAIYTVWCWNAPLHHVRVGVASFV